MKFPDIFPVRCLLALVSGLLFTLAFPPVGWAVMIIPGLWGLLIALGNERGTRARALGFIHGLAAFGTSLSWLISVFGWVALVLFCVLAAFTALFAEMQSRARARGLAGLHLAVFTALNWGGWEFIRAELFPLKFPWMTPGLALGPGWMVQWIGVYGTGFLMVLGIALFALRYRVSGLGLLALLFASTSTRPHAEPKPEEGRAVKVGGVQLETVSLSEYLKGSASLPADTQYVVWPEYAVPYHLRSNPRDWELVQKLCRERGITLTFGTQSKPLATEGWRNLALTVDSNGERGQHNKVHTVHFFDDGLPGDTAVPIDTEHGKVGTPVCFDCDYEGIVRRMTKAGAEWFAVPIMDARSWTARQHDQHAELFRIRACENGRWMFVCATSGVSQVIDPYGHVHARLGALEEGTFSGIVRRESRLTFYTRHGWLFPWIVLGIAGGAWVGLVLPRRRAAAG